MKNNHHDHYNNNNNGKRIIKIQKNLKFFSFECNNNKNNVKKKAKQKQQTGEKNCPAGLDH